ncbi:MAG: hypothetical protein JW384_02575 [Nitrosomonadaceae bacterium]|nr:hypothetical protein [Nitrosomonadaceae bacterium]
MAFTYFHINVCAILEHQVAIIWDNPPIVNVESSDSLPIPTIVSSTIANSTILIKDGLGLKFPGELFGAYSLLMSINLLRHHARGAVVELTTGTVHHVFQHQSPQLSVGHIVRRELSHHELIDVS